MKLEDLLKGATGTSEKPASPWTGVLYVFLSLLAIALAALPAILARRKAAKLAHQIDKLEEEKNHAEALALDKNLEGQTREHTQKVEDLKVEIKEVDTRLNDLNKTRLSFANKLETITSWEGLDDAK